MKEAKNSHEEKPEVMVTIIMRTKKLIGIGGDGNIAIMIMAMTANPRRAQKAQIQGSRGLSPRAHFPARYPANNWNGKSMSTASAMSSIFRPFSTILSEVTASFAWNPILETKWSRQSDWTSIWGAWNVMLSDPEIVRTFELAYRPQNTVNPFEIHVVIFLRWWILQYE